MVKHVSRAAMLVAVLAMAPPVWAETPMSPLRRSAPANASSNTAQQWVEPPAAPRSTTENAAPVAQPKKSARPMRNPRQGSRVARARGWTTRDLNRQQLYGGGGWSGASVPYYRGYGPAPYSNSGD